MTLSPDHAAQLEAKAVSLDLAERLGVRYVDSRTELPDGLQEAWGRLLPATLWPWTSPLPQRDDRGNVTGPPRVSYQLKPDVTPQKADGTPMKYVFVKNAEPVLWAVRYDPSKSDQLFVEGNKQCLVAAQYAPERFSVLGIAGCWGWRHGGAAISDLEITEGKNVYCLFDADAADKSEVYDAATLTGKLK